MSDMREKIAKVLEAIALEMSGTPASLKEVCDAQANEILDIIGEIGISDRISVDTLKKIARCDFESGKIFWKDRPLRMFTDGIQNADHNCKAWNAKFSGKEAFTTNVNGYKVSRIFQRHYQASHVVYALHYGHWPEHHIDHIDGNRTNNALSHLRDVDRFVNMKNCKKRSDNTSGHAGVYWNKRQQKWVARITCNKKTTHLGSFFNREDAILARAEASKNMGFTDRHGK